MPNRPKYLIGVWFGSLLLALSLVGTAIAQQAAKRSQYEDDLRSKLNSSTIGLAAGRLEGAPLRFATELARVVDDGTKMRVLPIVTRGPFENVNDLLYVRGIDAAIIYGDVLEHFKKDPRISNIEKRIQFIAHLFPSEVHVFVRPEIKSLDDLDGKPINFNTHGTAAAYSGPIIFERLGIKVQPHFNPHPVALAEMAKSEKYAAVVFVSSKPLDPFVKRKWPAGFKFLPVPLTERLEEYYMPALLDASDYPGLIADGSNVQTIAVPAVLAVYAWPQGSERYRRLSRFIDYMFERLPRLQTEPGYHASWREMNLAADVPGWQRFRPVQEKLVASLAARLGAAPDGDDAAALRQAIARLVPRDPAEQNRLFQKLRRDENIDGKGRGQAGR
jgi:TRAP-type uncharacterized transport system substrate-binding protein